LIGFHISGNNINIETLLFIRETLNIVIDEKKGNSSIENCHLVLGGKKPVDEIAEMRFFNYEVRHKLKFEEDFLRHRMDINQFDHYAFTRHLGV
jgi:hypothetical protein